MTFVCASLDRRAIAPPPPYVHSECVFLSHLRARQRRPEACAERSQRHPPPCVASTREWHALPLYAKGRSGKVWAFTGAASATKSAATVIIRNIACSASWILELLARAILALTCSRVSVRADRGEAAAAPRAGDSPFRLQGGTLLSFHTWTTTRCPSSQQWHRRFGHPRSWGRSPSDRER